LLAESALPRPPVLGFPKTNTLAFLFTQENRMLGYRF
jgi:hypothetical protein